MEKKYSIGELAKITGIEGHTIRFWSSEMSNKIQPSIGKGKRRYYTEKDIKTFQEIKDLIHNKGYTISMLKKGFPFQQNSSQAPQKFAESFKFIEEKISYLINLHEKAL